MDFGTWHHISDVKTGVLAVANVLIEDELVSRESLALDLFCLAQRISDLEEECLLEIKKSRLPQLAALQARPKKQNALANG